MMKRVSFGETIFLFFLALIVFGPKRLPEIARQIGKMMNEFRRASNEFKAQIEQEVAHLDLQKEQSQLPVSSAPPEGTASRTLSAGSELGPGTDAPTTDPPATLAASTEPSQSAAPVVATEAQGPSPETQQGSHA